MASFNTRLESRRELLTEEIGGGGGGAVEGGSGGVCAKVICQNLTFKKTKGNPFFSCGGCVSLLGEKCRSSCCFAAWFSSQRETDLPECLQLRGKKGGRGGKRGNADGVCFHQAVGADSHER